MAKVWLITCKCKALVQALTEAVLASGQNVVTTAVDAATVADLAERYGDQLRIVPVDVTSARAAETAIQATLDAFGRLDVLVLDLAKWRSGGGQEALEQIAALTNSGHRENKTTPSGRATSLAAAIHRLSIGIGQTNCAVGLPAG